jgi:hypothetical protein
VSKRVSRLDNIISRNKPSRPKEKTVVSLVIGFMILLILALAVFTDLGRPPVPDKPAAAPPPTRDHHVNDIKLWHPPAKH